MKLLPVLFGLFLAACSTPKPPLVLLKPNPAGADVADLVRFPEVVRAYHAGRYADPNHSSIMHEQHRIYRIEADSHWNLRPPADHAMPRVALNPPRDKSLSPLPLNDALISELSRQKDITETVAFKATLLANAFEQLEAALQENRTSARAQAFLSSHVGEMERRLEGIEAELRTLLQAATPKTEKPELSP